MVPGMKENDRGLSRRGFLTAAAAGAGLLTGGFPLTGNASPMLAKVIPSTGERIPAMGMGSYLTFNVGRDERARAQRVRVLQTFIDAGGGMLDSSPMYGASEEVIGYCLKRVRNPEKVFSATKVWTPFTARGVKQIENSGRLWGEDRFDLFQVHNLLNWEAHLAELQRRKEQGKIRYVGITTSHGRSHREFERVMRSERLDFVQLTYNPLDLEVEDRLLPLAADRGIAVIVNRPFRRGGLIDRLDGEPLPGFAAELGARTWAQLLLKFVISHPAVTVAIPATRRPDHARENMDAAAGPMPDAKLRQAIIKAVEAA